MKEPYYEERINDLSKKVDSLILGYKFGAVAALFIFSLPNLGINLTISKFRQIFQDALGPDHPLPYLTEFLIGFQTLVTCLAVLWPILGIFAAFRFRKISHLMIAITCLLIVVLVQITLTFLGLFMPMTMDGGSGMSDAH